MIGKKFSKLTVIAFSDERRNGKRVCICRCDCGKETSVVISAIRSGNTRSCGCLRNEVTSERFFKHGHGLNHRPYRIWLAMRERCNNPNHVKYKDYGGRGISVCRRWNDFSMFLKDMGYPPEGYSIDRIDNDGDYNPENCRWASSHTQMRNRRNNRFITYKGETLCLTDWAIRIGENPATLTKRLKRGWTEKETIEGRRS